MPYDSSTNANDRFKHRKKNRLREVLSARIDLNQPDILTSRLNLAGLYSSSLMDSGSIFPVAVEQNCGFTSVWSRDSEES